MPGLRELAKRYDARTMCLSVESVEFSGPCQRNLEVRYRDIGGLRETLSIEDFLSYPLIGSYNVLWFVERELGALVRRAPEWYKALDWGGWTRGSGSPPESELLLAEYSVTPDQYGNVYGGKSRIWTLSANNTIKYRWVQHGSEEYHRRGGGTVQIEELTIEEAEKSVSDGKTDGKSDGFEWLVLLRALANSGRWAEIDIIRHQPPAQIL